MWDNADKRYKNQEISWVFEGIKEQTLVWCADESIKLKVAPVVSGAGWMVCCTKSGKNNGRNYF